jgi:hypothetical protein
VAIPKRIEGKALSTLDPCARGLSVGRMLGILLKVSISLGVKPRRASGLRMAAEVHTCIAAASALLASSPVESSSMLRIEKDSDGCVTRLKLSGRIQSSCIARIRSVMNDGCARKILDLSEVTLVDIEAVRFLISVEDEGTELCQCPPYVREWILRERAEGAQPGLSDSG